MAAKVVTGAKLFVLCSLCWISVCTATNNILPQDCQEQKMDLVFLQDASYSVSNDSFEMAKGFISDIVRLLPIGPQRVRVALVRFGTYADVIAKLSQSRDVSTVTRAIAGMKYKTGGTQTAVGLQAVREEVLKEHRPDTRAVVVVITDGHSNNFYKTRMESRKLRKAHVRIVWLYINANDTDSRALSRERFYMAGKGDTTLGAASFESLDDEARMAILNASCKEDPQPKTSTTTTTTSTTTTTTTTTTKRHPLSDSPSVFTDSDADVTEPATSPTDGDENTSSHNSSSVDDVTSPKSSAGTSPHGQPSEDRTEASMAESNSREPASLEPRQPALDITITGTEPATSEPHTSAFVPRRKSATETSSGSTSLTEVTTQERSPSSTAALQGREEEGEEDSDSVGNQDSESGASKGKGSSEGDGAWEDDLGNILGLTIGGFAVVAVSSGCIYYAIWRRKQSRNKKKPPQDA